MGVNNMTKKDKLKKYSVTVSKTILVSAINEYEAEGQARDWQGAEAVDYDYEVNDE